MTATISLLDKYKESCSLFSDNACAISLHITRSTVSGWRLGKSHPDAESVEKMCLAVGDPLRQWLPLIEAERSTSPANKRVWLRLAQTAASLAGAFLIFQHTSDAHAAATFALLPVDIMRTSGTFESVA